MFVALRSEVENDVQAHLKFAFAFRLGFSGEQLEFGHELALSRLKVLAEKVEDLCLVVIGTFPPAKTKKENIVENRVNLEKIKEKIKFDFRVL